VCICEGHLSFVWSEVSRRAVMPELRDRWAGSWLVSSSSECHCQCPQVVLQTGLYPAAVFISFHLQLTLLIWCNESLNFIHDRQE